MRRDIPETVIRRGGYHSVDDFVGDLFTSWKLSIMSGSMFSERREFLCGIRDQRERNGLQLKEAREYLELSRMRWRENWVYREQQFL